LLPWLSPEGKPCYLVPGSEGGFLSRLADDVEAAQLGMAAEVLHLSRSLAGNPNSSTAELRFGMAHLSECLSETLRIAESRGTRLPEPDDTDSESDSPTLPAETKDQPLMDHPDSRQEGNCRGTL
jgi:hypothetical protein